jgi:type II secretory pathway pseudopilin PulG
MRWKNRGLSMPELMVAMTVLFVVSSLIMSMFVTGMRQTAQATQNQDLESLTRQKLSELREMDYALLDGEAGTEAFDPPYQEFQSTVTFTPLQGETLADARVVEVSVTHPDYGTRSARTVRCNIVIDPGKAAWEKFACGSCHSLPGAGYEDPTMLPLGPIPVGDPGFAGPRPIPPGPGGLETYIRDSIVDPTAYEAYDPLVEGTMTNFYVEGEPNPAPGDPPYDPNNSDEFIRLNSMSDEEVDAMATWISTFQ